MALRGGNFSGENDVQSHFRLHRSYFDPELYRKTIVTVSAHTRNLAREVRQSQDQAILDRCLTFDLCTSGIIIISYALVKLFLATDRS